MRSRSRLLLVALALGLPADAQESVSEGPSLPGRGWYAGASMGVTEVGFSGGQLESDLAARGFTAEADVDDTDRGFALFAGHRFHERVGIELAYVDLGDVESRVTPSGGATGAFLEALGDVHAFGGHGLALSARGTPLAWERWSLDVELGAFFWEAEVEVDVQGGGLVDIDESGVDPLFGAAVRYKAGERWSLLASWEEYGVDDESVSFLSVGAEVSF
jgi:hypothetical protein